MRGERSRQGDPSGRRGLVTLLALAAVVVMAAACQRIPYDFDSTRGADPSWVVSETTGQIDEATGLPIWRHRWYVDGEPEPIWDHTGPTGFAMPEAGDYDGDGRFEPAIDTVGGIVSAGSAGALTDPPRPPNDWGCDRYVSAVPGQWDDDPATDVGWYRNGAAEWVIEGREPVVFGRPDSWEACAAGSFDVAVPADYDGDGRTDIAVFQVDTGHWLVHGVPGVFADLGVGAGYPAPADYDGDGTDEPALVEEEWQTIDGSLHMVGTLRIQGRDPITFPPMDPDATIMPAVLDYDGDGAADPAVLEYVPMLDLVPQRWTLHRLGLPPYDFPTDALPAIPSLWSRGGSSQLARAQRCEASPPMICDR